MKILLTLFVLLFSPSVFSDDISDFQIEGMSIGDSLLDYFSDKEINNGFLVYSSTSNIFFQNALRSPKYKVYDIVDFSLKNNDNNHIIYGITGGIFFNKDFNDCLAKKDEIEKDISLIFINAERIDYGTWQHPYDESKKSTITQVEFNLDISNDSIVLSCYDWSKKITKELGWTDNLSISIWSKEYADWVRENPT